MRVLRSSFEQGIIPEKVTVLAGIPTFDHADYKYDWALVETGSNQAGIQYTWDSPVTKVAGTFKTRTYGDPSDCELVNCGGVILKVKNATEIAIIVDTIEVQTLVIPSLTSLESTKVAFSINFTTGEIGFFINDNYLFAILVITATDVSSIIIKSIKGSRSSSLDDIALNDGEGVSNKDVPPFIVGKTGHQDHEDTGWDTDYPEPIATNRKMVKKFIDLGETINHHCFVPTRNTYICASDTTIYKIDTTTLTVFDTYSTAAAKDGICYNPVSDKLYAIGNLGGGSAISEINPDTFTIVTLAPYVPGTEYNAIQSHNKNGKIYYSKNITGTFTTEIREIDPANALVSNHVTRDQVIHPDNNYVYGRKIICELDFVVWDHIQTDNGGIRYFSLRDINTVSSAISESLDNATKVANAFALTTELSLTFIAPDSFLHFSTKKIINGDSETPKPAMMKYDTLTGTFTSPTPLPTSESEREETTYHHLHALNTTLVTGFQKWGNDYLVIVDSRVGRGAVGMWVCEPDKNAMWAMHDDGSPEVDFIRNLRETKHAICNPQTLDIFCISDSDYQGVYVLYAQPAPLRNAGFITIVGATVDPRFIRKQYALLKNTLGRISSTSSSSLKETFNFPRWRTFGTNEKLQGLHVRLNGVLVSNEVDTFLQNNPKESIQPLIFKQNKVFTGFYNDENSETEFIIDDYAVDWNNYLELKLEF